jgi:hypothetical protein
MDVLANLACPLYPSLRPSRSENVVINQRICCTIGELVASSWNYRFCPCNANQPSNLQICKRRHSHTPQWYYHHDVQLYHALYYREDDPWRTHSLQSKRPCKTRRWKAEDGTRVPQYRGKATPNNKSSFLVPFSSRAKKQTGRKGSMIELLRDQMRFQTFEPKLMGLQRDN